MTDLDRIKLFDGLMAWVCMHTEDAEDYVYALKEIGFSREQAAEELEQCGYEGEENERIIRAVYGEE